MSVSSLKKRLVEIYQRVSHINYVYEIWPFNKSVDGVRFRSFDLLGVGLNDELLHRLLSECRDGEVIYDIGGNIGHYALPLARSYPDSEIHVFEPNPSNALKIQKNVEQNSVLNIEIHNIAVSDRCDVARFFTAYPHGRGSFHRNVILNDGARITGSLEVHRYALDNYIAMEELATPDRIKIDVEGHELAVLHGAEGTLSSSRPTMYIEPHSNFGAPSSLEDLYQFLDSKGYIVNDDTDALICEPSNG